MFLIVKTITTIELSKEATGWLWATCRLENKSGLADQLALLEIHSFCCMVLCLRYNNIPRLISMFMLTIIIADDESVSRGVYWDNILNVVPIHTS